MVRVFRFVPSVVDVVSSTGAAALTTISALTAAGFIVTSSDVSFPSEMTTPRRTSGAIPSSRKLTTYSPGGRMAKRYVPSRSASAVRVPCIAGLFTSTLTPGSEAPDESVIFPVRLPVVWANSGVQKRQRTSHGLSRRIRTLLDDWGEDITRIDAGDRREFRCHPERRKPMSA